MTRTSAILLLVLAAACAAGPAPRGPQPTAPDAEDPRHDVAHHEEPGPLPTANTATPVATAAPEPEPPEPTHCPEGMVLVEGEYCSKVEHHCKREWFDKSNKKRVCEEFHPSAKCVGKKTTKRFCIDKYSWPNKEGVRPEVMNTFYQAQVKCAAAGKRMCTESEWTMSCEGPEMKPFPYGYIRDAKKCNGDHKWDSPRMSRVGRRDAKELARLWRGVPSGSQPECVSDYGVADLPANTDEVVAGEKGAKYYSVNTGGPWYKGVRNQCRPKIYTHDEGFYYYFLSFRCCAEPDGAESEPLTEKQQRDGFKWKSVERLAGFNVEQMQQVMELKEKGECTCEKNKLPGVKLNRSPSYLCKTMCGTLLGPGAKDGDDSTRLGPG